MFQFSINAINVKDIIEKISSKIDLNVDNTTIRRRRTESATSYRDELSPVIHSPSSQDASIEGFDAVSPSSIASPQVGK